MCASDDVASQAKKRLLRQCLAATGNDFGMFIILHKVDFVHKTSFVQEFSADLAIDLTTAPSAFLADPVARRSLGKRNTHKMHQETRGMKQPEDGALG